jgi:hypothetical protein
MYELLAIAIVLLFLALKYRETFVVKYGNPFDGEDAISFDPDAKGKRLFGITPDTCPANKPVLDAGLCYEPCIEGYHGVGPVCWANTANVGVGKIPLLQPCDKDEPTRRDWYDDGLLCRAPLRNNPCKFRGLFNECWPGLDGGQIEPKKMQCTYDENTNFVDGLCYKKCPKNLPNRVPGMPYLCFKGSRGLSYGRGVGDAPPIFAFGN